ncbi:MAG: hypothetical protein SPL12_00315 [Bacteroidales bacterium]|nr:hypothetical protein [Bacteroidales bacterium]
MNNNLSEKQEEFLQKLAETYQTYNPSIVQPYLAEDVHYASLWVFQKLKSKQEYLDYLSGKLDAMKNSGKQFDFRIVDGSHYAKALLVGTECGFVVDFNDDGKVCMINMTAPEFF